MTAFLTIFTPVYNRAGTISRTYQSLLNQENKDFIWLVIDDGSNDNTGELVRGWMEKDNRFEIQYIYKKNGGMHTAHNTAYENIHTELNVCIDSDDALAPEAVSNIYQKWQEVKGKGYAGIIGLDADMNSGKIIGTSFPKELKETTLNGFYASGGKGDKKLVYRTDVINKYPPYPVFDGEKYVALAYKYRLIDQDYKLAVLNKVLCNVEYQPDGSSHTMPKGFAFWRKVCMKYPESKKRLVIDCIHYCSSSILARNRYFIRESPQKVLTFFCIPAGQALAWYIKKKVRESENENNVDCKQHKSSRWR